MITAYDLQTNDIICQLFETKGCTLFTIQERNCSLFVINKKKISYYVWHSTGFDFITERSLQDVPKLAYCLPQSLILGYRRFYESIDISTFSLLTGMSGSGSGSLLVGVYVRSFNIEITFILILCN